MKHACRCNLRWKLDSGRIAKKHTEGDKWTWAGGATTKGDEGACKYFQSVADMKKKANVKDLSNLACRLP